MPKKTKDELIEEKKSDAKVTKNTSKKVKKIDKTTKATKANKTSNTTKVVKTTKADKTDKTPKITKAAKKMVTKKNNKSTTKSTKKATKTSSKKTPTTEYYDLPNSYNQTIVKILAQTPTILFAYWDICEKDVQNFINSYGEDFFNNTIPFLVVTNKTKNYSFEVEINDYANSWYISIPDSDCKYDVSLIRKAKNSNNNIENNYVFITSSDSLQTPNDHILFENFSKNIFLKNVKTGVVEEKDISSLSFMKNIGRIYNIYDLYKEIYKNELKYNKLDEKLTSSKMSSF